ncbi:unnamed protein product [Closterium sp. NIES-65]|nr:unnamed protein product [Closterium sp. NIES-65]
MHLSLGEHPMHLSLGEHPMHLYHISILCPGEQCARPVRVGVRGPETSTVEVGAELAVKGVDGGGKRVMGAQGEVRCSLGEECTQQPADSTVSGNSWAMLQEWEFMGHAAGVGIHWPCCRSGNSWAMLQEWEFMGHAAGVGIHGPCCRSGNSWAMLQEWEFMGQKPVQEKQVRRCGYDAERGLGDVGRGGESKRVSTSAPNETSQN